MKRIQSGLAVALLCAGAAGVSRAQEQAAPHSKYVVVDVSAGPSAARYPVSHLQAVPSGGWADEHKTTKIVLRHIPAVAFMMGSPADELGRYDDEGRHQVTLSRDFYIGVFEVTQKQWERVMGTWPSYFNNARYRNARPVENVSYNAIRGSSLAAEQAVFYLFPRRHNPDRQLAEAVWPASDRAHPASFMGLLRAKTGKAFDLPTEAQWEYACRAGTGTALNSGRNLTNPRADENMDEVGRYWYNGGSGYTQKGSDAVATAKAGSYLPNAWGLYDMHGNVWEWCLDWYGPYSGAGHDPKGATTGSHRVDRGGSWSSDAYGCRSADRDCDHAEYHTFLIGFRVACP
jgi:formylglycine-generating enzyme required for sulfatase activity